MIEILRESYEAAARKMHATSRFIVVLFGAAMRCCWGRGGGYKLIVMCNCGNHTELDSLEIKVSIDGEREISSEMSCIVRLNMVLFVGAEFWY